MDPLVAAVLTPAQQTGIDFFRELSVPAQWFIGTQADELGRIEVIAVGEDFVWSFIVDVEGEVTSQEAPLGEFSTGIDC